MKEKNRKIEINEEDIARVSGGNNNNSNSILINLDLCDGCQECAKECSEDCISFEDGKAHIDEDKCSKCCICEVLCPPGAIKFI